MTDPVLDSALIGTVEIAATPARQGYGMCGRLET
jgi:hypothetical protein